MRKRVYLGGTALCLAVLAGVCGLIAESSDSAALKAHGGARAAQLARELGPGVDVAVHRETGRVRFIGASPARPIARPAGIGQSAPPSAVARVFVDAHGEDLGLSGGSKSLRVSATTSGPRGESTVRFQQEIGGVPVLAGELAVTVDGRGNVLSLLGETEPQSVDTTAQVSAEEARRTAIAVIAKHDPLGAATPRAGQPRLGIYDSRLLGGPGLGLPTLVWQVEVATPGSPLRELVLVDTKVGVVAETIDLTEEVKDRRVCDAANSSSRYPCAAPYDRQEGNGATGNVDIDLAYDFAGDTYDFYSSRFGRDSLDGAGLPLLSTVRLCPAGETCPYANAFWDGSQMAYGQGFAAADDVVGHELSHGFTQYTSNLFYWYQSGAINESMSDVFGELMDLTNGVGTDTPSVRWLIGEDIPTIGAIRDMQDPAAFNDPDRMTSSRYVADIEQDDSGGVHTNSGVNNKAGYLITDGDTFNGKTVTGLGIDKAARIYYEAESSLLTSGSDYADLYEALQQACTNSIGGSEGITASDCVEVTDAVDATEMNQQPLNGPAPEAPVCGTSQTPVGLFFDDLENPASGNWTHGAQSGTDGWYYPQNPNPFSFDATYATSGDMNIWGNDEGSAADYSIAGTVDVAIPAGAVYLRFDHSYAFEDKAKDGTRYDGGQLEYSVDGGKTWLDAGSLFTDNGYNGQITKNTGNPLAGESAFTAESHGYISSRVDLSTLAGKSVRFRFRIGTDASVDDYGWFIDDVRVYKCEEPIDTTPPAAPQITATAPDSPANDNSPEVKGSAESSSTVKLYATANCSGAPLNSGSAAQFASPGITVSVSDNTTASLRATATDAAGNASGCSGPFDYIEDSLAPTNPTLASPSHTTGVPSGDQTVEVTFTGASDSLSGLDGFSYHWDSSSSTAADTTKDAEEGAAGTTSPALADGSSHYLHLRARDNAGNWSVTMHLGPFVIDTTPPAAPQITATAPDSPANDNSPEVKGSAESSSTVKLYATANCSGAPLNSGSAAQFASPGITVSVSDNTTASLRATATDAAGNASGCSGPFDYIEDSSPPQTTIDAGPSGSIADSTPEFTFSADDPGAVFECRVDSALFAACTSPHTTGSLTDGSHTFEVRAVDQAGNPDSSPASRTFTVDTQDPSSQISFPLNATPYKPTAFAVGCADNTPDLCGSASDSIGLDEVELSIQRDSDSAYWNGASWGVGEIWLAAQGTGSWTFDFDPDEDTYTLRSRAIDTAGNTESSDSGVAFTIDGTAPQTPQITATAPDSPANDNSPEVKGSAESSSTVKLYATANCSGAPLNSGSAAQFASPGITVSVSDNTTTSLRATATDAAGNASGCSGPFDYIEDSLAPEPEPEPTPPVEPSPAEPSPVPLSDLTFGLAPSASNIVSKASIAVNVAPVMGGSARLRLQCVGDSVCRGTITLIVWIKARKPARQSTLRHVGRQAHGVLIGKRPYAIAAGRTRLIQVRLTRRGKALLRRSGRRGLRARLRGPGLQNTTVRLQPRGRRPRS